jgi:hypothetical protein
MATCSFAGFLLGPRVFRSAAMVALTPPPDVTVAWVQSIATFPEGPDAGALAFAAVTPVGLERDEVRVGFFSVGMAAGDEVRGVVTVRSPDQENDAALPQAQALQPKLTVAFAIVFHRDHRVVKDGFQFGEIDPVLSDVLTSLWLIPRDHDQTVYAF